MRSTFFLMLLSVSPFQSLPKPFKIPPKIPPNISQKPPPKHVHNIPLKPPPKVFKNYLPNLTKNVQTTASLIFPPLGEGSDTFRSHKSILGKISPQG